MDFDKPKCAGTVYCNCGIKLFIFVVCSHHQSASRQFCRRQKYIRCRVSLRFLFSRHSGERCSKINFGPGTGLLLSRVWATTQHISECPHERSKVCCDVARNIRVKVIGRTWTNLSGVQYYPLKLAIHFLIIKVFLGFLNILCYFLCKLVLAFLFLYTRSENSSIISKNSIVENSNSHKFVKIEWEY